jgi:8-hydroxy-5-deazaflavin:NADPH oxidoreductase
MKIAFIGHGQVGAPLADRLQRAGHQVTLAVSNPNSDSVQKALARNAGLKVATPSLAVRDSELVFLATPFSAQESVAQELAADWIGKPIVDCTNPVGPGLTHGLQSTQSGAEALQALAPQSPVVKAFSIYGYENFEDNHYPDHALKPVMLFCGDHAQAKQTVAGLIAQLDWEPLDVGPLAQALHLEHMTLLWVRMVRAGGRSPHRVWATLAR